MTPRKTTSLNSYYKTSSFKNRFSLCKMFALISVSFILFFQIATSVVPCRTPNGQNGDCKLITQCDLMYALFEKKMSDSQNYLRKSHCGFEGRNLKVCCPIGSSLPPKIQNPSATLLPQPPFCGSHMEETLWGGNKTSLDEFPWMALLMYSKNSTLKARCAGVLISRRYILTAKHCLKPSLKLVRLGEWDMSTNPDCIYSTYGEDCASEILDVQIEEQIGHEGPMSVLQNDIALLRLSHDVEFNDFIKPICLPKSRKSYVGEKLTVSGWGLADKKKNNQMKLKAQIPVMNTSSCDQELRQKFGESELMSKDPICGRGEAGKDACIGDGGGPLMYDQMEWYLAGIKVLDANCGQENVTSVYVRVDSHIDWIISKIRA